MTYVLEKITPADIEKIFADADETKRSHLRMRGGHFSDGFDTHWAIDRKNKSYLLRAPTVEARSPFAYFYFHFNEFTYGLRIQTFSNDPVQLDDVPQTAIFEDFKLNLLNAFSVLQANEVSPLYVPYFESKGE